MISAFFFDMDNTLVATEWAAAAAVKRVVESYGHRFSAKDEADVIGLPWEAIFDNALAAYPMPLTKPELKARVLAEKAALLGAGPREIPGAVAAVKRCARLAPVAVVSGSFRGEVEETLRRLGILDDLAFFLANEDCLIGKPAPDPYLRAAARLGADPTRAVVFEDSTAGLTSARRAGMIAVAITSEPDPSRDLSPAHRVLTDFTAVDEAWLAALAP